MRAQYPLPHAPPPQQPPKLSHTPRGHTLAGGSPRALGIFSQGCVVTVAHRRLLSKGGGGINNISCPGENFLMSVGKWVSWGWPGPPQPPPPHSKGNPGPQGSQPTEHECSSLHPWRESETQEMATCTKQIPTAVITVVCTVPPPLCPGTTLRKNQPLVPQSNSRITFFTRVVGFSCFWWM
jgi:hypothetical protein